MRIYSLLALSLVLSLPPQLISASAEEESKVPLSVVKISAAQRQPDLHHPWLKEDATDITGSGVIIEGRRILTNAHLVGFSSQVFVQAYHSGEKIAASVAAIAPDIDLAILKLADDSIFETHPPLIRSSRIPKVKDPVFVHGYPTGGDAISITKGVVSRVEFTKYYYKTTGLRVQVDAAINPGNSGGPAVVDDKMVGLDFSRLDESDNIGYIIPVEEVELFLSDVADGKYDGKPTMYDVFYPAQNDALRRRLGLDPKATGMLVSKPARADAAYPLKPWDLITQIGDHPIDSAGMVQTEDGELHFTYYLQKLTRNGTIPLEIIRDGKRSRVDVPILPSRSIPSLFPPLYANYPSYLVWGTLVFSPASQEILDLFESEKMAEKWFPYLVYKESPLLSRHDREPHFEGEQLVVVVSMIPHRLAKGYHDLSSSVVDEVNGTKVRNLRHLAELLRASRDEFVVISFHDRMSNSLVFDRKQILEASDEILSEGGIRHPYSDDLRPALRKKE